MPTWPASLPVSPDAEGYSETGPFPVVRTPTDSGRPLVRRRFTAAPHTVTARYLFTEAQLVTFEDFWKDDLMDGALEFDGPTRGVTGSTANFQYTGAYQITRDTDPYWLVTVNMIRLP